MQGFKLEVSAFEGENLKKMRFSETNKKLGGSNQESSSISPKIVKKKGSNQSPYTSTSSFNFNQTFETPQNVDSNFLLPQGGKKTHQMKKGKGSGASLTVKRGSKKSSSASLESSKEGSSNKDTEEENESTSLINELRGQIVEMAKQ